MAKQLSRLRSFFEGKRRRCTLDDYHQLKTSGGEDRMKLIVSMPLTGAPPIDPLTGIPDDFAEELALMSRDKSSANFKKIAVEVKAAKLSIFSTDTIKGSTVKTDGVTLNNFRLIGSGVDEKRSVTLDFAVYLPYSEATHKWCGDHFHMDFFAEIIPSQMTLEEEEETVTKTSKRKNKDQPVLVQ